MSETEVDQIKAAKEKLMTDSQSLFQKVYEQAQAAQGAQGQAGPDMSGAYQAGPEPQGNNGRADDNVVDADYKEV